jgi:hypothetical protein
LADARKAEKRRIYWCALAIRSRRFPAITAFPAFFLELGGARAYCRRIVEDAGDTFRHLIDFKRFTN